jgi:hypothetical protein
MMTMIKTMRRRRASSEKSISMDVRMSKNMSMSVWIGWIPDIV